MQVGYKPSFVRQLNALEHSLRGEALERMREFGEPKNHKRLHVHPLKGKLKGFHSFSVNYRYRIVFKWIGSRKSFAVLTAVGDHDIYE